MTPLDDILFWSRQLEEHAMFLHLGLEEPALKDRAANIHAEWGLARSHFSPDMPEVAAARLILKPIQELQTLQDEVHGFLLNGKWLGWLYPSFVGHIQRELRYAIRRINKDIDGVDTLTSNLIFMQEHAEFAAGLLDPKQKPLIRTADTLASRFESLRDGCDALTPGLLQLSYDAGAKLDAYLKDNPISANHGTSVIHPVLAAHVVREGERFMQTLQELSK